MGFEITFFENERQQHDGSVEIIIRKTLKNIVIAAEGLKDDGDACEDEAGIVNSVFRGGRTQKNRCDHNDDHNDGFGAQKADALHADVKILVAVSIQHQIQDLVTEKICYEEQGSEKNQIITADPHSSQPKGRQEHQSRKMEQGSSVFLFGIEVEVYRNITISVNSTIT